MFKLLRREWNIFDKRDAALFAVLLVKSNGVRYSEDPMWYEVFGEGYKLKIVKNMLYRRMWYGPFQVEDDPVYDFEGYCICNGKQVKFSYHKYERSRYPDYMKATYDIDEEEAREMGVAFWENLLEHTKPRWGLRRLLWNLRFWIAYRGMRKSLKSIAKNK